MNLPRLTAEAAVYRTCEAYRTEPSGACDTAASIAPAAAAERIAGLEAASDYINRMDLTLLKQKLTLPPSWGGQSWPPERAAAAETKYKKWLFLQRKYEDVALSPGPPGRDLDIFWHYHVLDTEAYIRDTAQIFGRYLHHPPDFGAMGNDIPQCTRRLFRAEYGEELVPDESGAPTLPVAAPATQRRPQLAPALGEP
jgi:hypothetical protein